MTKSPTKSRNNDRAKTHDDKGNLVREAARAVRLYNTDKPHIKLKRLTPAEFEKLLSLQPEKEDKKIEQFESKDECNYQK